jgi:hypothetical protein
MITPATDAQMIITIDMGVLDFAGGGAVSGAHEADPSSEGVGGVGGVGALHELLHLVWLGNLPLLPAAALHVPVVLSQAYDVWLFGGVGGVGALHALSHLVWLGNLPLLPAAALHLPWTQSYVLGAEAEHACRETGGGGGADEPDG